MTLHIAAEIVGTGSYLPETSVDNYTLYENRELRAAFDVERARSSLHAVDDPAALSDAEVFDCWTKQMTGIHARRVLDRATGMTTEDMAAEASLRALEAAGMEARDLDLLYVASLTCADEVPNAACTVADRIGAPELGGYLLNAACAGFVSGLASGWAAIAAGMAESVLVASADTLTRYVSPSDTRTAVLFGDGAGAVVLRRTGTERGVLGPPVMFGQFDRTALHMVGQGWETDEEPVAKLHMVGGPRILRNAITAMARAGGDALSLAGLAWADVDLVVPHQANARITAGLAKHLGLGTGQVVHNIRDYGNMSASSVAVTLDEIVRGRHGEIPDPATTVLTAIGGGYTVAAAVVRV